MTAPFHDRPELDEPVSVLRCDYCNSAEFKGHDSQHTISLRDNHMARKHTEQLTDGQLHKALERKGVDVKELFRSAHPTRVQLVDLVRGLYKLQDKHGKQKLKLGAQT